MSGPTHIQQQLLERSAQNALRSLCSLPADKIDFSSNDYLGLAREHSIQTLADAWLSSFNHTLNGATGSRLISGNHSAYEAAEKYIAQIHHSEDALIYNSGYDANIGLLSCIAGRNDTIIYDEYVHASIRDGIRLSLSRAFSFQHNNTDDLVKKIGQASGQVFIVTESVFSMDGDEAPLKELAVIAHEHQSFLIVDEAHATGVMGWGKTTELSLEKEIFARVVTYGKAMGAHGAAILCSNETKQYLINFSRPLIYTTGLAPASISHIMASYQFISQHAELQQTLQQRIDFFKKHADGLPFISSASAIQCMIVQGNTRVKELAQHLWDKGFFVKPILHPTVPKEKERLRICLHAFNTEKEISDLINSIRTWEEKYSSPESVPM